MKQLGFQKKHRLCALTAALLVWGTTIGMRPERSPAAEFGRDPIEQQVPSDTLSAVLRRVAAQREGITSGSLVFVEHVYRLNDGSNHLEQSETSKVQVWLSDNNRRTDKSYNVDPVTLARTKDTRRTILVAQAGGKCFVYSEPPKGVIDDLFEMNHQEFEKQLRVPVDLPEYGIHRVLNIRKTHLAALLHPEGTSIRLGTEPTSGNITLNYEFQTQARAQQLIVDPRRDYLITCYKSWGRDASNVPWKAQLDITYMRLSSGRYFPESMIWRNWYSRGASLVVAREERFKTVDVSINEPIDPDVFEVWGLGLPPNTGISEMHAHVGSTIPYRRVGDMHPAAKSGDQQIRRKLSSTAPASAP